jgi:hypothetical protein
MTSTVLDNAASGRSLGRNLMDSLLSYGLQTAFTSAVQAGAQVTQGRALGGRGSGEEHLDGDARCLFACEDSPENNETRRARAAAIEYGNVYEGRVRELPVKIYGGTSEERQEVADALYDVLGGKSARGVEMRMALDQRRGIFAADPNPLEVVLVQGTAKRTRSTDLMTLDLADIGRAYTSVSGHGTFTFQRLIAHEVGHIAFDAYDDGLNHMFNVQKNENVVMRQLGNFDNRLAY